MNENEMVFSHQHYHMQIKKFPLNQMVINHVDDQLKYMVYLDLIQVQQLIYH